ncbi:alcohol dehydrogenase [Arthrobacter sp. NicSoilB4]|uniref:NAD(P)-dependent alcohol dehydrogenase n=1 Tax=Arthrobacter sp. NicSoilB4 TaxID=2830997 RepID=UPI001CC81F8A|nr:NAD(P)-dependent alcohol dehydrogenase [Arthrobacter sp. NicSoilB4]BCW68402.1 alcohol dehydrogenase [Arthrobacter sp. NicSoilB4]
MNVIQTGSDHKPRGTDDAGTHPGATMRAAAYRRFGGPEVVRLEEVPRPSPRPDEVLIRVHASTLSAADRRARSRTVPAGLQVPTALALGVFRPRRRILGMDVAGVVEATGSDVSKFKVGDEVVAMLGSNFGGHAEYVAVRQDGPITAKPRTMNFAEAVTLVFGGLPAQRFLALADVEPGDTVLINGASGAVGTAAVQLAKHLGAQVTAVCSGGNSGLVASLGADHVIDYTAEDFTARGQRYDVIMDCVGNAPFSRVAGSLKPGGALLLVVADLKGMLQAPGNGRRSGTLVTAGDLRLNYTAEDLAALVRLAESGHYKAVIDRTYPLTEIVQAHRFVDTGRKKGNVIVQITSGSPEPLNVLKQTPA